MQSCALRILFRIRSAYDLKQLSNYNYNVALLELTVAYVGVVAASMYIQYSNEVPAASKAQDSWTDTRGTHNA